LFFCAEIVGGESVAAGFDNFNVASQLYASLRNRAESYFSPMA
jgi:hypothetical protein